jgi:hypothetical protein
MNVPKKEKKKAAPMSTMRSNLSEADTMKYNIRSTIYLNKKVLRGE